MSYRQNRKSIPLYCWGPTLIVNETSDTGYRCIFCEAEDCENIPAACDICGIHTTIGELDYWDNEDGTIDGRCYYCSGRHLLDKDD